MVIADEGLRARRHPFDGLADLARREHQREIFRIGLAADAETTADVVRVHAQLVLRYARADRQARAHADDALRGNVEVIQPARRVVFDDGGLGLHRIANDPRRVEREFHDMRGAGEGRAGRRLVPIFEIEGKIVLELRIDDGRVRGERGFRVDDGWQVLVIDHDLFRGLLRGGGARGDDQRHFLTNEDDLLVRHHLARHGLHLAAALAGKLHHVGRGAIAGRGRVRAGDDGQHARRGERLRNVDAQNICMATIGAQEVAMGLIGEVPVGRVFALAGDEPLVLAPSVKCSAHANPVPVHYCLRRHCGTPRARTQVAANMRAIAM